MAQTLWMRCWVSALFWLCSLRSLESIVVVPLDDGLNITGITASSHGRHDVPHQQRPPPPPPTQELTALHLLPHRAARENNGAAYSSGSGSASFWRSIQALAALRRYDAAISTITSQLASAASDEARFQLHFASFWVGLKRDAGRELAAKEYAAGSPSAPPEPLPLDPDVERAQRGMQAAAGGAPLNAKVLACTGLVEGDPAKQLAACEALLAAYLDSKRAMAKAKSKAKGKAKKSQKRGPGLYVAGLAYQFSGTIGIEAYLKNGGGGGDGGGGSGGGGGGGGGGSDVGGLTPVCEHLAAAVSVGNMDARWHWVACRRLLHSEQMRSSHARHAPASDGSYLGATDTTVEGKSETLRLPTARPVPHRSGATLSVNDFRGEFVSTATPVVLTGLDLRASKQAGGGVAFTADLGLMPTLLSICGASVADDLGYDRHAVSTSASCHRDTNTTPPASAAP